MMGAMFRNNPQFVVLLIFFGLSGLSWIMNKLREQKQIKQINDARRKRREEELRTGRSTPASPGGDSSQQGEPLPSLEELAARRQRQLEELRARQQAKARQGGKATPPVVRPTGTVPQSRPTIRPAPPVAPPQAPQPPVRPIPPSPAQRVPTGRAKPGAPKRRQIVIGSPPKPKPQPSRPTPIREAEQPSRTLRALASTTGVSDEFGEATTHGLLTNIHAEATGSQDSGVGIAGVGAFSRDAMRRAIIMSEVLSPPVSMREGH